MHLRQHLVLGIALVAMTTTAVAQPPPGPVRYTLARRHEVHRRVQLPGTVEARTASAVASEVEGFVVEMIAREGESIEKGKPLARLRTRNLELRLQAAKGQLQEIEAQQIRARRALERAQRLLDQKLVHEEEFDDTQAEVQGLEGSIQRLQADIERIELDLRRCTIRAPFTGVVVGEHIDVGSWINVGAPVVDLVSLEHLEVRVEVPERYYRLVRRGTTVTVTSGSSGDPQSQSELPGEVIAVIPRADVRSRVFPVKVGVADHGERLVSGMSVQVSLPVGEARTVTLVPKDAIVSQGTDRFVFVITEEGAADRVPVKTGEGHGPWVELTGIDPGTRVITRGNERIFPGQPVNGEEQEYAQP